MTSKLRKSRENDWVFVEHVLQLLGDWGEVKARSMFGGFGLYRHGVMFGLIADAVLYLKVDDTTRSLFEAAGSRPFTYTRQGRAAPIVMSYFETPVEALERATLLAPWAERAYEAALRARSAKQG